ncbi:hypothetical protein BTN49_3326 [Candidatus Enterovibrio escicola]|uniref:Uncharacterized protein n=2 Tax=Candidatus Enterovibrio escicola TaxID=1927127 RepID=A0A2A5SZ47_9GAMM|nr:hypothetical protein [Candidatus Enterovibrio escacola]PCS21176.1 hypothetical protein BTN49_3326 [Candidatus Enterovibrio escacola]
MNKTKNCGSQKAIRTMVCKQMRTPEVNWRRIRGFKLLTDIIKGVKCRDVIREINVNYQDTDLETVHQI